MKSIIKKILHKIFKKITKVEIAQNKYGSLLENKVILITGATSDLAFEYLNQIKSQEKIIIALLNIHIMKYI